MGYALTAWKNTTKMNYEKLYNSMGIKTTIRSSTTYENAGFMGFGQLNYNSN